MRGDRHEMAENPAANRQTDAGRQLSRSRQG